MLWKRIISAVIGIMFLFIFIFWGSLPFTILVILTTFLVVKEYNSMLPVNNKDNRFILSVFSIIIIIFTYLSNKGIINFSPMFFFTFIVFALFVYHLFKIDSDYFLERLSYNLLGIIYIGGGMSFFILLRDYSILPFEQTTAIWLVLLTTWAEDTGAYFIGVKYGKTKFIDKSPNKTIEGAIGGIIFAIIVVSIFTNYMGIFAFNWLIYAILAAIIAMLGDLFESSLKRAAGVKDSGNIMPGHGGILDRLDSLFFSAPFTYFFLLYFL